MCDLSAVYDVEAAHRRQLIAAGVLSYPKQCYCEVQLFHGLHVGDVFLDDLVLICLTHFSLKNDAEADRGRVLSRSWNTRVRVKKRAFHGP